MNGFTIIIIKTFNLKGFIQYIFCNILSSHHLLPDPGLLPIELHDLVYHLKTKTEGQKNRKDCGVHSLLANYS